ncbi:MAG: proline--tRNA ligase, partial [Nitratireductor sp.]
YVKSYKNLPLNLYHIQWKFRDEVRPRFGVMRGREFLMKDAYSFDIDEACARASYNRMFVAYLRTFERMGLKAIPMQADTGPIGGDLSHEFIILADTGENEVFCDKKFLDMQVPPSDIDFKDDAAIAKVVSDFTSSYARTDEMHDASEFAKLDEANQVSARGIEVGHIFYFGTKYSQAMNANVMGKDGREHPVHMGSYGIGPSRLVAAIIEAFHDDDGIRWPKGVAPFDMGIINMKPGHDECDAVCEKFYKSLTNSGHDVLYDDTDNRAGAKFATMDLIGLPIQIIAGPRAVGDGTVEIKNREDGSRQTLSFDEALNMLTATS